MKYLIENIFYLIKFSKAIKIWASWKNTVKKSKSENWSSLAATSLEMTWRSRSARSVRGRPATLMMIHHKGCRPPPAPSERCGSATSSLCIMQCILMLTWHSREQRRAKTARPRSLTIPPQRLLVFRALKSPPLTIPWRPPPHVEVSGGAAAAAESLTISGRTQSWPWPLNNCCASVCPEPYEVKLLNGSADFYKICTHYR